MMEFGLILILMPVIFRQIVGLENSNVGTRFLVTFPQGVYTALHWEWENLEIHVAAVDTSATVDVTSSFFNTTVTVSGQTSTTVHLPKEVMSIRTELGHRSILVTSDADVSVVASNIFNAESGGSPDAMLIFPHEVLGTDYVVSAYTPFRNCEFVIANTGQRASISMKLKITGNTDEFTYFGRNYKNGETMNVKLKPFETLEIKSLSHVDLTGTTIHSTGPVAVFSGNKCTRVPIGVNYCDYAIDQLLPVNTWGTNFVVPPLYPRVAYAVRVIAFYENTNIQFINNSREFTRTLNQQDFTDLMLGSDPLVINSDEPISVLQFAPSIFYGDYGKGNGDPFLTVVPALDHFSGKYFTPVPIDTAYHTYLAITIKTGRKSGLRLNGQPINAIHETDVMSSNTKYTVITTSLNTVTARVEHQQDNVRFGVVAYGNGKHRAYGFPLGMTFPLAR